MTALKLYKFINENNIEIDWRGDELVIWVSFYDLKEFAEMLGRNFLSEGGYDVNLQNNCIALDIVPICEYFDIETTEIFAKEN
jgi:predicted aspartyl protease